MGKHLQEIMLRLMVLVLCHMFSVCARMQATTVVLDSREVCMGDMAGTIYWASEEKAILVIGRGADDRGLFRDCSIVIGAATANSRIIQLKFDAFHIIDCGVVFAVNQSDHSDFKSGNTVMAKIGCNHGQVNVLHSRAKHFVKISVHKEDNSFQQYNFRINVTLIDKRQQSTDMEAHHPNCGLDLGAISDSLKSQISVAMEVPVNRSHDKLPETGPETHVVIIVGIVVVLVVGMAMWLLVKYLIYRTQRWHEHCAERNMERAIRLYNNQETPPESDYMYTALPPQDDDARQTNTPASRNGHCHQSKNASSRSGRHRAGEITFVHADGHIETFRLRDSPQERRSGDTDHTTTSATARSTRLTRDRDGDSVAGDTQNGEDILGEVPPSYEEALHMPTPQDPRSPLYVNLDSKKDDNHTT